ncbi:unnamed protein product [marine sediment metagenome]|uniref:Uncharacterized protein n=1 Tax=marine sediment metagenome TaxID=412755 RepID=X0S9D5_9ZZZZ
MSSADRVKRDQLLRSAVLAGDEQAWQRWYEETFDDLYKYVHWRCAGLGDRTDEVVQETWLTAVRRVRQFDPKRASFYSWLQGIAVNVLRNQLRRQQAASKRRQPLGSDPVAKGNAESTMEDRERGERIIAALDALPEQYESVLRAKYLDGLSVAEIAARWDKTAKAVESLLTRARQKFRDTYRRFERNGKPERI